MQELEGADLVVREMRVGEYGEMVPLLVELNPVMEPGVIEDRLEQIKGQGYGCVGAYSGERLVGICGYWETTRIYSGRQLELDNVVVAKEFRNKGVGRRMLAKMEEIANAHGCQTMELNTYVTSYDTHRFYMNEGFVILGYHMKKDLE